MLPIIVNGNRLSLQNCKAAIITLIRGESPEYPTDLAVPDDMRQFFPDPPEDWLVRPDIFQRADPPETADQRRERFRRDWMNQRWGYAALEYYARKQLSQSQKHRLGAIGRLDGIGTRFLEYLTNTAPREVLRKCGDLVQDRLDYMQKNGIKSIQTPAQEILNQEIPIQFLNQKFGQFLKDPFFSPFPKSVKHRLKERFDDVLNGKRAAKNIERLSRHEEDEAAEGAQGESSYRLRNPSHRPGLIIEPSEVTSRLREEFRRLQFQGPQGSGDSVDLIISPKDALEVAEAVLRLSSPMTAWQIAEVVRPLFPDDLWHEEVPKLKPNVQGEDDRDWDSTLVDLAAGKTSMNSPVREVLNAAEEGHTAQVHDGKSLDMHDDGGEDNTCDRVEENVVTTKQINGVAQDFWDTLGQLDREDPWKVRVIFAAQFFLEPPWTGSKIEQQTNAIARGISDTKVTNIAGVKKANFKCFLQWWYKKYRRRYGSIGVLKQIFERVRDIACEFLAAEGLTSQRDIDNPNAAELDHQQNPEKHEDSDLHSE